MSEEGDGDGCGPSEVKIGFPRSKVRVYRLLSTWDVSLDNETLQTPNELLVGRTPRLPRDSPPTIGPPPQSSTCRPPNDLGVGVHLYHQFSRLQYSRGGNLI